MLKFIIPAAAAAFAITALSASAATTTETFDTDPAVSPTPAPGTWYTDRYAPAGFESENFAGDNRLKLSLSAADGVSGRSSSYSSSFYNTQGRKFDTPGALSFSIDMYIDSSFETDPNRIGGIWGTGVDATNAVTSYPIVEFGGGGFRYWDGLAFQSLGLPTGFVSDTFVNIGFSLDTAMDEFTLFAGDQSTTLSANGTTSLANVILQGINTDDGIDRDIYFDNFTYSDEPAPVPLPAGLPLLLLGLGALGVARRRA